MNLCILVYPILAMILTKILFQVKGVSDRVQVAPVRISPSQNRHLQGSEYNLDNIPISSPDVEQNGPNEAEIIS